MSIPRVNWYALLVLVVFVSGCGSGGVYVQTSLSFTPEPLTQTVGRPVQLHLTASYSDGSISDVTSLASWTSAIPSVAGIDNKGQLTCRSVGQSAIAATIVSFSKTTTVVCSAFRLTLGQTSASLLVSHPMQMSASAAYTAGQNVDVTSVVTWSTSNSSIATISKGGVLTCLSEGSAEVSATLQGVLAGVNIDCTRGIITITGISPLGVVGQPSQLNAIATLAGGTQSDVTLKAMWSTRSPSVATVTNQGVLNCLSAGQTSLAVATPDAAGVASVTCVVPQIAVTGTHGPQLLNQPLKLTATATLTNGVTFDVTNTAVWSTQSSSIVNVNTVGTTVCISEGTASISASANGGVGTAQLSCTGSTLAISGVSGLQLLNRPVQLHAVDRLANGTTTDVTNSALWSSSASGIATVSNQGLLNCLDVGTTHILAVNNGLEVSALVNCSAPQLVVNGIAPFLLVSSSERLTAVEYAPDGTITDVSSHTTWSTQVPSIAQVIPDGTVTCRTEGVTAITARADGAIAINTITCSSAPVSLTITPSQMSTRVGDPVTLSASAHYANGQNVDISSSVTWLFPPVDITVTPASILSCNAAGQFSIGIRYLGLSQQAQVICSPPTLNTPTYFSEASDEFAGPFPSWANVKTAFGAVGDGLTDDTVAIQEAIDSLNTTGASAVLWFPAGTYNIRGLHVTHKYGFSIVGEDPSTTRLSWIGDPHGTMLQTDGSTDYKMSRLTFDGRGIADTAEVLDSVTSGGYYQGFVELSDQHIRGVKYGVRLPKTAETTVERVYFDNIPTIAFSVEDWNTLNIFVNDSLFLNCGTGLSNTLGAGHFFVANSYFKGSTTADMSIQATGYFSARHNASVASQAFFVANWVGGNPAQITIQNNTVLDSKSAPLYFGNMGPLMLLDNVFRMSRADLPFLQSKWDPNLPQDFFSIGNTFSPNAGALGDNGLPFAGRTDSFDDSNTPSSHIPDVDVPANVYTPPNRHRRIYEVSEFSDAAIQQAISQADNDGSERPIVHLRSGTYHVRSSITFRDDSQVQLIGDSSNTTVLLWDGPAGGSILDIHTSDVSVRDLAVQSATPDNRADGILLTLRDQPNLQIIVDQAQLQGGNDYSVKIDGIEHATAEMFSTYTMGAVTGLNVAAGPFRAAHEATVGITNQYTGSLQSEGTGTSFNVDHFGKFMVRDNWHDLGATSPRNFVLSGSGTVTEDSGLVGMSSNQPFEIDGFDGDVTLMGLNFTGGFKLSAGASKTNLLNLGLISDNPSQPVGQGNLTVSNLLSSYYSNGGQHIAHQDIPDAQWLRRMLAETRTEFPIQRLPLKEGGHRIRLSRLEARKTMASLHYVSDHPPSSLYYTLTSGTQTLSRVAGGCPTVASYGGNDASAQWLLVGAGDGDYQIAAVGSTEMLAVQTSSDGNKVDVILAPADGSYKQRWLIQNRGDGGFDVRNRQSGLLLATPIEGQCASMLMSGIPGYVGWTIAAH